MYQVLMVHVEVRGVTWSCQALQAGVMSHAWVLVREM